MNWPAFPTGTWRSLDNDYNDDKMFGYVCQKEFVPPTITIHSPGKISPVTYISYSF